ncbi:MAG: 50S ribosomal protein L20 [Bacteroidetes bacterium]|nr:50S ribosomal protein L20 [Bacteroidota bacterium]
MPRSVNSVASRKRRKRILKQAKGFFGRRKNVYTVAKNAIEKSMQYAYTGRKLKKRDFRGLWIQRINAAVREEGLSYSQFMGLLHKGNIQLNRKVLADLAMNHPEAFKEIVKLVNPRTKKAAPKKEKEEKTVQADS